MSDLIDNFVKQGCTEEEAEMMLYDAGQDKKEAKECVEERMIIREMTQSVWQEEQKRLAKLKVLRHTEDKNKYWLVKENLKVYKAAFEAAEGDTKVIAERRFRYAMVCEQNMRERRSGVTTDMMCEDCGCIKGRGISCSDCCRWREAFYGGTEWVEHGNY